MGRMLLDSIFTIVVIVYRCLFLFFLLQHIERRYCYENILYLKFKYIQLKFSNQNAGKVFVVVIRWGCEG